MNADMHSKIVEVYIGSVKSYLKSGGGLNRSEKQLVNGGAVAAGVIGSSAAPAAAMGTVQAMGFTQAGVAAGSFAASVQTPFTVAGSTFATLQSVGATGVLTAGMGAFAVVSGFVLAGAAGYGVAQVVQFAVKEHEFKKNVLKPFPLHCMKMQIIHLDLLSNFEKTKQNKLNGSQQRFNDAKPDNKL
eukprot:CAMPEP_0171502198 /NCGR_PEP_ID=MMETSP0958-20121227/10030_1 /TAXON_ID=87120 /ORGANISM="Aurantiochytrium limacinum, Strain ATCCMYA-1381" /LENGTH=186 /DNA_ID=CAMNT_0012037197 /DNA_START=94 /DNA_END=654 /DNA_ORIENTATION=-